mmetsp:Transcript_126127/g.403633  ORF Transcript_126127/g.403633 Transcript_126127/m.403633 type:complete len:213 (+) Transcript_126127:401-1039(+)
MLDRLRRCRQRHGARVQSLRRVRRHSRVPSRWRRGRRMDQRVQSGRQGGVLAGGAESPVSREAAHGLGAFPGGRSKGVACWQGQTHYVWVGRPCAGEDWQGFGRGVCGHRRDQRRWLCGQSRRLSAGRRPGEGPHHQSSDRQQGDHQDAALHEGVTRTFGGGGGQARRVGDILRSRPRHVARGLRRRGLLLRGPTSGYRAGQQDHCSRHAET